MPRSLLGLLAPIYSVNFKFTFRIQNFAQFLTWDTAKRARYSYCILMSTFLSRSEGHFIRCEAHPGRAPRISAAWDAGHVAIADDLGIKGELGEAAVEAFARHFECLLLLVNCSDYEHATLKMGDSPEMQMSSAAISIHIIPKAVRQQC